jgi:hypothetical protein
MLKAFPGRNTRGPADCCDAEIQRGEIIRTHNLARQTARFRISIKDNLARPALKIELCSSIGARSAVRRNGHVARRISHARGKASLFQSGIVGSIPSSSTN